MARKVGLILIVAALVTLIVGAVFIWQGVSKNVLITQMMAEEQVDVGIPEDAPEGEFVDTIGEAQNGSMVLRSHRQGIAVTYRDLLGEEKFDPTNISHAKFAQAINLENALQIAALSLGLTYVMMGIGAFMLLMAVVSFLVGMVFLKR
ncbi:MAG TPA: hypothetical protein PKV16_05200 [Caldisericia bacterium]|nr:hypothetical protein [Caldisericia bacterium]HPF48710.1 hypothetical protein [Caldisericia bacterium]HPI83630.1 hypothetical protein [Caldisericia bacterium]HPQ93165.1 hypothetical protein [Caldisericia bacterium]HRV75002.1 hypothetical protein [Caldisericia bacterium]